MLNWKRLVFLLSKILYKKCELDLEIFLPKTNSQGDQNPEISIVFSALYIRFGILLIFMTFEMVQDQVVSALKKVALRLIKEYN